MNLRVRHALTGEGELSKRDVAVHAVVDEADAHALSFHLHARDQPCRRSHLALSAVGGQGKRRQGLSILEQPTCCLFQLTCKEIKR